VCVLRTREQLALSRKEQREGNNMSEMMREEGMLNFIFDFAKRSCKDALTGL
jgi:hypothetical protein